MKYTITCASLALLSLTAIGSPIVVVDQSTNTGQPQIGSQVFPNVPNQTQLAFDDFTIASSLYLTTFTAFGGAHTGSAASNVSSTREIASGRSSSACTTAWIALCCGDTLAAAGRAVMVGVSGSKKLNGWSQRCAMRSRVSAKILRRPVS